MSVGVVGVILLSLVLLIATFAIGLLPLVWSQTQRAQNMIAILSQFGIGMLLGTSFMLVIPEGVSECLEHNGNVGLNLLIGFLAVYILDRISQVIMSKGETDNNSSVTNSYTENVVPFNTWRDVVGNPKGIITNVFKNNVVFALFVHGLSDGIALGTALHNDSLLIVMLIAIIIHKIPAVLSLSSIMICKQQLPKWESITNLFMFAASTPIGYIVLSMFSLKQSETMNWLSGNLLLMSGGSLLYAAFTAFTDDHGHDMESTRNALNGSTLINSSEDTFETTSGVMNMSESGFNVQEEPQLKYDKSVYTLSGVILPVIISFIIKE